MRHPRHPDAATPALRRLQAAGVAYEAHPYEHVPSSGQTFGEEAAAALHVAPERIFKTLIASVDGMLVATMIPASRKLDLKALAAAMSGKRARMAGVDEAERAAGSVIGAISPLGMRRPLPSVVDESVFTHRTVLVSAGQRGLDVELGPADLVRLTAARNAPIAR